MELNKDYIENSKEEEDNVPNLKIKMNIKPSSVLYKSLDFYVEGNTNLPKLDKTIPNFESFQNKISQLLSTRKPDLVEIDYRYIIACKKNNIEPNLDIKRSEKMSLIGKLYVNDNYTTFDFKKGTGNF